MSQKRKEWVVIKINVLTFLRECKFDCDAGCYFEKVHVLAVFYLVLSGTYIINIFFYPGFAQKYFLDKSLKKSEILLLKPCEEGGGEGEVGRAPITMLKYVWGFFFYSYVSVFSGTIHVFVYFVKSLHLFSLDGYYQAWKSPLKFPGSPDFLSKIPCEVKKIPVNLDVDILDI